MFCPLAFLSSLKGSRCRSLLPVGWTWALALHGRALFRAPGGSPRVLPPLWLAGARAEARGNGAVWAEKRGFVGCGQMIVAMREETK